jgi:nicotinic acid mononucleotide adenylyltransferase
MDSGGLNPVSLAHLAVWEEANQAPELDLVWQSLRES